MAFVTGPDGRNYTLSDAELPKALAQGYRVRQPSPAELARTQAAEQPLVAAGEAVVRTAVPFVGQELLTGFEEGLTGQSESQVLKGQQLRKEENPLAAGLGAGVGFAAGPGKVASGVLAPLRSAGILGTGAAGLVEGGLFGLEEAVNESMVDQTPLTAEKVAASVAASALTGGALDFGMGAVSKGASTLLKTAGGKGARELLGDMATDVYKKQLVSKSQLKRYNTAEYIDDIVKFGEKEGILTRGSTYESVLQGARDGLAVRSPTYDLILDGLEGVKPARTEARAILDDAQNALKKYDKSLLADTAESQLKRIEQVLLDPQVTWRQIHKIQSDLFAEVPPTGAASGTKKVLDSLQETLQQTIEKRLDDNLVSMAEAKQLAPELEALGIGKKGFIQRQSKEWAQLKRLESMAEDQLLASEGRAFGFKELAMAGASGAAIGGVPGVATAVGGGLLGKSVRERGGFVLGGTLRKLSESQTLEALANSFQKNVVQRLATAPELLGPFRGLLEQAASQGAMDLMQTHVELMNSRQGPEYARRMGIEPPSPGSLNAVGQKIAVYDALSQTSRDFDDELNKSADAMFGSAPGRKGGSGVSITYKDYRKTVDSLKKTLSDPEGVFARVPSEFLGAAPGTTGMVAQTVMRGAGFLMEKAPKNPFEGMPPSIAPEWRPSAADLDKFGQYKEAVESPARVLKNLANGYVSPEQIEALQAVYPAIYADLQAKIGERLSSYTKPLTYKQKIALTPIVGPAVLGMTTQQVAVIQQSQMLALQGDSGQGGSVKPPDGRQDVNEAQMETESQKLEGRA